MDALQQEASKLRKDAQLQDSIDDVDKIIEQLERAREMIVAGMGISYLVLLRVGTLEIYSMGGKPPAEICSSSGTSFLRNIC